MRAYWPRWFLALMLTIGAGLLAVPARAGAELCSSDGHICIVNPPTAATPWVAPQLVQLRLPSEADPRYSGASWTQPGAYYGEFQHRLESGSYPIRGGLQLLEQGPPGGMSLYQGIVEPEFQAHKNRFNSFLPVDGALTLTVVAKWDDSAICHCLKEATATFSDLPVLGAVGRFDWRIVRSGKWFQAVMSFDARTPIRLQQLFYVSRFREGEYDIVRLFSTRLTTGTGPQRIVQKLSTRYVHHKCSEYSRCQLWADGELVSGLSNASLSSGLLSGIMRPIPVRKVKGQSKALIH